MKQPHFTFPHSVLILTEIGKPMRYKLMQGNKCMFARDRPSKSGYGSRMVGKLIVDKLHNFLGDAVWLKSRRLGQMLWALLTKATTIFRIKVPLIACRSFTIHQNPSFLTHFTVKKFKAYLFATSYVLLKCFRSA